MGECNPTNPCPACYGGGSCGARWAGSSSRPRRPLRDEFASNPVFLRAYQVDPLVHAVVDLHEQLGGTLEELHASLVGFLITRAEDQTATIDRLVLLQPGPTVHVYRKCPSCGAEPGVQLADELTAATPAAAERIDPNAKD